MAFFITDDCVSCGICLENCPINAIEEGENQFNITEACIMCGACVSKCPIGAIIEKNNG